jgi:phenylacetate-CoA ligase
VTGGEVLTPLLRQRIIESVGGRVVEMYGAHELGLVAWQCPGRGTALHVADDGVVLEILKDGRPAGPGEAGEVVATPLHAFAMRFIRYRLGDLVTRGPAPCPCGAPFSTVLTIQGRMLDHLVMPDGSLVHPYALVPVLLHAGRWLGQYQLTQETRERVVLRVTALAPPAPGELRALEAAIQAGLGAGVHVQLLVVPEIPPEINGKFRASRSLVASVYDGTDWDGRRAEELVSMTGTGDVLRSAGGGGRDPGVP